MPNLTWIGGPWSSRSVCTLVIFLFVLAFHLMVLGRQDFADDLYFSTALEDRTLLEFLAFRYQQWTGRLPIEAALVIASQHVWLWKLLNSLVFVSLCWALASLSNTDSVPSTLLVAFTACLLLTLSPDLLWWSAWWLTGSVNYLWPATAAAISLALFWRVERLGPVALVAGMFCGAFAAYSEQIGLFILAVVLIGCAWKALNRSLTGWHSTYLIVIGVNFWIALSAPGNAVRFEAEQETWFPDFMFLRWSEKLNIGLGLLFGQLLSSAQWILMVGFSAAIYAVATSGMPVLGRSLILAGLSWVVLNQALLWFGYTPNWLVSFPLSEASGARPIVHVAMVLTGFSFACLVSAVGLSLGAVSRLQGIFWSLVLGVGAGTLVLVGWTPTSTASGSRIAFVFSIVMVVVTAKLLVWLWDRGERLDRSAVVILAMAVSFAALLRAASLLLDGGSM